MTVPLYDYRCDQGHVTEIRRNGETASTSGDVTCPHCGQPARRLYRLGGVGFKGPGFYSTDTRPEPPAED